MDMKATIEAATDTGKVRDHNEDSFLALGGKSSLPGVDALLVVADGMGGHAAGEVASQMTVDGIKRLLASEDLESPDLEGNAFGMFLGKVLEDVNQEVWQAGQTPEKQGMGTTCTLAAIRGDQLFLAHIGDSRAYLIRDGEMHQVSTDHSWVEEAVAMGTLTREEARVHPNRNVITRAIGLDQQVKVDTSSMPLAKGDLILLCSDGLNSMIPDDEIKRALLDNGPEKVCQALIDSANNAGGHDNTTVVVATIGEVVRSRDGDTNPSDRHHLEVQPRSSMFAKLSHLICRRK
jgi:serine/threonine protein phosphatase PrpC